MTRPTSPPGPSAETEVRNLLAEPRPDLGWHHALGRALDRVRRLGPEPKLSVQALADRFELTRTDADQHLRFAQRFDPAEVAEVELPWTSAAAILPVADPRQRLRLLQTAAAERWPLNRVRREVRLVQPPTRPGTPGRRVAADVTEFWRLAEIATDLRERYRLWAERLTPTERVHLIRAFVDGVRKRKAPGTRDDRVRRVADAAEAFASLHPVIDQLQAAALGGLALR